MTIHYGAAQGLWDNLTDTMGPDSYRQMIGPPKVAIISMEFVVVVVSNHKS